MKSSEYVRIAQFPTRTRNVVLTTMHASNELRRFMLRSSALKIYRDALRVTRGVPEHAREAVRAELRSQFRASIATAELDPAQESFLIGEAAKTVENLQRLCQLVK